MSEKTGLALDVAVASLANKTTVGGAAAGAVGWLVDINWIGLVGLGIAALGFLVNVYFSYRKDKRETAESEARIAQRNARLALLLERRQNGQ